MPSITQLSFLPFKHTETSYNTLTLVNIHPTDFSIFTDFEIWKDNNPNNKITVPRIL